MIRFLEIYTDVYNVPRHILYLCIINLIKNYKIIILIKTFQKVNLD